MYLDKYADPFYEWGDGVLFKMSPISEKHDAITAFLGTLLRIYLLPPNEDRPNKAQVLDKDGLYCTRLLPQFALHVATLWKPELPIEEVHEMVKAMLS